MLFFVLFLCAFVLPLAAIAVAYVAVLVLVLLAVVVMLPAGFVRSRRIHAAYATRQRLSARP